MPKLPDGWPENSDLKPVSLEEVKEVLTTPGTQILKPDDDGNFVPVYRVQEDGRAKKLNADDEEGL